MKLLNKLLLVVAITAFFACDDVFEIDLQDNPNRLSPEQAGVEFLYNNIQNEFRNIVSGSSTGVGTLTSDLARMTAMTDFTYVAAVGPTSYNGLWNNVYADLFPDVSALQDIATETGLDVHAGSAQIMKAYSTMVLVDLFGNVPFSEAGLGAENLNPRADDAAGIYGEIETMLDEAIAILDGTTAPAPDVDNFYNGDPDKWITLAKTLKLRLAVTARLVDPSTATNKINALLTDGDLIDAESEDFQYNYGNQRTNPNNRHPYYNNFYENDDGTYLSNYYMWLVGFDKDVDDPRLPFYFFRQETNMVREVETNPNAFDCIFTAVPPTEDLTIKPPHYQADNAAGYPLAEDHPFCLASLNGYFGRDHGNGSGIPPDGPIRTAAGLYPAGGSYDAGQEGDVQNLGTDGALGQGIAPIMLSSFAYFLRAEAAQTLSTNDNARTMLEMGIRASMDKVLGFADLVDLSFSVGSDPVTGEDIPASSTLPTAQDVEDYVTFVLAEYDAADATGQLNVIMREYYLALWTNGLEAYNAYRRTGMPLGIQPLLVESSEPFITRMLYPSDYIQLNTNAEQQSITGLIFWDSADQPGLVY